jgi:hypothetical protein
LLLLLQLYVAVDMLATYDYLLHATYYLRSHVAQGATLRPKPSP